MKFVSKVVTFNFGNTLVEQNSFLLKWFVIVSQPAYLGCFSIFSCTVFSLPMAFPLCLWNEEIIYSNKNIFHDRTHDLTINFRERLDILLFGSKSGFWQLSQIRWSSVSLLYCLCPPEALLRIEQTIGHWF